MLDLHRLKLLREIKIRGSITAAAQSLAYSHSAISQQMTLLEKEAGVALLERVGRGVQLTDAAIELVRHVEDVLAILERAESDLATARHEVRGTLVVTAFSTASRALVPGVLVRLGDAHPQLHVCFEELEPEQGLNRLSARRADIVIADEYPGGPLPVAPALHAELLGTDPISAYLPAGTAATALEDLAQVPWVMEPEGSGAYAWTIRMCRDLGFEPDVRYRSADLQLHLRLIAAGRAASFLPDLALEGTIPSMDQCKAFPLGVERKLYAVSRKGSEHHPAILGAQEAFRSELATVLRRSVGTHHSDMHFGAQEAGDR